MSRTDAQVALDEVISALQVAADDHADAADLAPDPPASLLAELAESHRQRANQLMGELRQLGELPSEPDADRRDVRRLARHLKARVAGDEALALLRDREHAEDGLARAIAGARREALPDSAVGVLSEIAAEVAHAQRALSDARIRLTSER